MIKKIYQLVKYLFLISLFIFESIYISIIGIHLYTLIKWYFICYIFFKILEIILELYFNIKNNKRRNDK